MNRLRAVTRLPKVLWRRTVRLGFRLLYTELAWLYDPVSYVVSIGHWRDWQKCALPYLSASSRVLEVGPGPGHLVNDLASPRCHVVGIELSPSMLRQATHRLRDRVGRAELCRGRAEALPFTDQIFDAAVATFPTSYIYDPCTLSELARVLGAGGKLVIVLEASLVGRGLLHRCLDGLNGATGQRGPAPDIVALLGEAGFLAHSETMAVRRSEARVVVGTRRLGPRSEPAGGAMGVESPF